MSVSRTGDVRSRMRITSDYALRLVGGEAPVWDDLRVPALATRREGSKQPGISTFADDGAGSQGV